jgi:RNA polymerase sigma-70 factor (ECF subfamily)
VSRREAGDDRDDDALVVATAAGDLEAFRVLVERFAPRVHAFAVRALGSRADADDIVQETFVRAHRAAPRFVPEGRCAAWLFRIAGNLVRQEARRRRVRGWFAGTPAVSDAALLASLPAPRFFAADAPLAAGELRAALVRALARLPERQRLAVLLRYFDGLAVRDVAAALGASEHATESLLARGTATLRRLLAPDAR